MSVALARNTEADEYTADRVALIRRTIMPRDTTNDELALFVGQCRRTGLDPLSRQIHATKRGGRLTIQVGIDGFRLVAARTGEADGQDGPYWCGDDGVWKEVWLSTDKPAAAKVVVYRKGQARGYAGVARMAEFYQPAGGMWDKLPTVMLAKVAESIALRKAFPQELSGLYTPEEMDQARDEQPESPEPPRIAQVATQPPRQETPFTLDDIRAKWQGAKLNDGPHLLRSLGWLEGELTRLVPGYPLGDLQTGLWESQGWGEEFSVSSLDQAGLTAAKAWVGEYLPKVQPTAKG